MNNISFTVSFVINLIIFAVTTVLVIGLFRKDGNWCLERAKNAFRFFTVQSNVLCAISSLAMMIFPAANWAYFLKVIGTAAVSVTLMTVLLFLGPTYGYQYMFKGSDLFMHLLTPIMALVSLCAFERSGISLAESFIGVIPVALYGPLYCYKTIFAPEGKRWDDFYGFNKDGKWVLSYVLMHLGSAVICVVLYMLLNI